LSQAKSSAEKFFSKRRREEPVGDLRNKTPGLLPQEVFLVFVTIIARGLCALQ
jgi:hypothetical protein